MPIFLAHHSNSGVIDSICSVPEVPTELQDMIWTEAILNCAIFGTSSPALRYRMATSSLGITFVLLQPQALHHNVCRVLALIDSGKDSVIFTAEITTLLHSCKASQRISLEEWRRAPLPEARLHESVQRLEEWWSAAGHDTYQRHLTAIEYA